MMTFPNPFLIAIFMASVLSIVLLVSFASTAREGAVLAVELQRERGVAISFDPARFNKLARDLGVVAIVVSAVIAAIFVAIARLVLGDVSPFLAVFLSGIALPVTLAYARRLIAAYMIAQSTADGVNLRPLDGA